MHAKELNDLAKPCKHGDDFQLIHRDAGSSLRQQHSPTERILVNSHPLDLDAEIRFGKSFDEISKSKGTDPESENISTRIKSK